VSARRTHYGLLRSICALQWGRGGRRLLHSFVCIRVHSWFTVSGMSVAEKQRQLISDLCVIEDVQERLSAVVARASKRRLADERKRDEFLVKGCVSRVWVVAQREGACFRFETDADSPMVKGLVALLGDVYDGGTAEQITALEPELWTALGFHKILSPTRLNGLAAVRQRIKMLAADGDHV
jgi:cysteine desulfuration protein SufE